MLDVLVSIMGISTHLTLRHVTDIRDPFFFSPVDNCSVD